MRAARSALLLLCTACVDEVSTPCPTSPPAVAKAPVLHSGVEYVGLDLDPRAVGRMMAHAEATETDAIVVMRDGKILIEEYFSKGKQPIKTMSASKSVTNLAIGALVLQDPKVSLDEPVMKTFPEVQTDEERSKITLRNVMSHTTGLASEEADWHSGENNRPGVFDHFLKLPTMSKVGDDFRYNNPAIDIIGPYITRRTKQTEDVFLQRTLFDRLGIHSATWLKDQHGEPFASGTLIIEPLDLAKIGQLVLQDGVWEGKRLLPEGWIAMSTKPSQPYKAEYGLLWWLDSKETFCVTEELVERWLSVGVSPDLVAKLRPLVGRELPTREFWTERSSLLSGDEQKTFWQQTNKMRVELARTKQQGPVRAFYANGWAGQYLVIVPSKKIVAVRMHAVTSADYAGKAGAHEDGAFMGDVRALAGDFEE